MNTNDLDRDVMNQDADFILGTGLAGWIAGLALCVSILLLAAAFVIAAFVIAAVAGVILNIVRALLGKPCPPPKRAYWDPSHPRYHEAHTVYLSAEPPAHD